MNADKGSAMSDDSITTVLLRQLAAHHATMAQQRVQRAKFGAGFVPPQIAQARAALTQLKADLRAYGVAGDDESSAVVGQDQGTPAGVEDTPVQRTYEQHISGSTIAIAIAGNVNNNTINLPPATR